MESDITNLNTRFAMIVDKNNSVHAGEFFCDFNQLIDIQGAL